MSDFSVRTLDASTGPEEQFETLGEAVDSAEVNQFGAVVTESPRGLALTKILLRPGLRDAMARFMHRSVPVYFVAWAWDLSGNPIEMYPSTGGQNIIPVGTELREVTFLGAGASLFQPRQVHAGIAVRVQLWQSRSGARSLSSTLRHVASILNESELNTALIMLAAGTGIPGVALASLAALGGKVADGVGKILNEAGDRFIDYFEGYFPASEPWAAGDDGPHVHEKAEITLRRLV